MDSLLVIDDEPNIGYTLQECLSTPTLHVATALTGHDGLAQFRKKCPSAVLLDVRLPDMTGLETFAKIRELDARVPVIMMTAFARTETAIEAMSRGAFDYLIKPVDFNHLRGLVDRALAVSRLSRVPAVFTGGEPDDPLTKDQIVGISPEMQEVYKMIGRVAQQDATVLILGESGTGKELVARAVYHYSRRSDKPFLAINCAALPESLLESELFGHERGAFTGADQRRIGKFEQVNGGTIFLDEIGDMSPATQAKALRLLQQQQFERVGGNETIQTDVRIIAATNKDLRQLVAEGKFRQDLLYRLNGFTIDLPPLRLRHGDIVHLAEYFLRVFNIELKKTVRSVSPEAIHVLEEHDWPGNVREFQSALKFAMVKASGDVILPECLPDSCRVRSDRVVSSPLVSAGDDGQRLVAATDADVVALVNRLIDEHDPQVYRSVGQVIDRLVLSEVLHKTEGNQQKAAELLGISRMTLRNKIRALGLSVDKGDPIVNDTDEPRTD